LHDEITADYTDMICAATPEEMETRRKAFMRKWRLEHRAIADSLFTFTRLPTIPWRSARTSNAIVRLHEEFKQRIKTQSVLPSAETAATLRRCTHSVTTAGRLATSRRWFAINCRES